MLTAWTPKLPVPIAGDLGPSLGQDLIDKLPDIFVMLSHYR